MADWMIACKLFDDFFEDGGKFFRVVAETIEVFGDGEDIGRDDRNP